MQVSVPEQAKYVADGLATVAWLSALTGVITNIFALIAAIASAAWCVHRYVDYLQRKKRAPGGDDSA